MMTATGKPVILTFIGNYLPGYKSGGIQRVMINTVDHLCEEFDFRIVTRDRDLGDDTPYPDITPNQWQPVGNAQVFYLTPECQSVTAIYNVIVSTPHHMLYLNSFFDPLTIKVLFNRKIRRKFQFKPVIVAPWGEFGWASLVQKYPKKYTFIKLAKIFGIYDKVIWRASTEIEKLEIIKVMHVEPDQIQITGDFPIKSIPDLPPGMELPPPSAGQGLRIIFLSRIAREKNLDYALKLLKRLKSHVIFDIYGPAENETYWKECQELIDHMPPNVLVSYRGRVEANQVVHIFRNYDLFLFPTGGEAYGHVIAESLTAGTPVLLSTETPWRDLQKAGLGWDIDLSQMGVFVETIEKYASMQDSERSEKRAQIKSKIGDLLLDPSVAASNRELFSKAADVARIS